MKKNKAPLTAPAPVNVQRAAWPPLAPATGEKLRAAMSQAPCGSSISPPALTAWGAGDRCRIVCVSV